MAIDLTPSAPLDGALSVTSAPSPASSSTITPASLPGSTTSSSPTTSVRTNKRPRAETDEVKESDEQDSPLSSSSSAPASPLTSDGANASGEHPSAQPRHLPTNSQVTATGSSSSSPSHGSAAPAAALEPVLSFAPTHVGRTSLLEKAGIDCRMTDVLSIGIRVDMAHPQGTPTIANIQYRTNDEARRDCAVAFIKNKTGLAIVCPTVPRYLVLRGADFDAAVSQLSADQRSWHDALAEQARTCFDVVRDNSPTAAARVDACEWMGEHLEKATGAGAPEGSPAPLWLSSSSYAASWDALLPYVGTSILRDTLPKASHGHAGGFHSYTLRLQGANPLLTHVLACQFSSYALLRSEEPEISKAWQSFITTGSLQAAANKTPQSSISTDSSADSDDDGWQRARSEKRLAKQQQRNTRLLPQRATEFLQKHITGKKAIAERFTSDTTLPLLALSTTLHIRAWEHKYTAHLIDNFESLGCDTRDLAQDPTFVKLSTSFPDLAPPFASWVVNPRNGGDAVTIYVRDQDKDKALPAALNARVKTVLPHLSPELRVRVWVWRTTSRGRIVYSEGTRPLCLNETMPVVHPLPAQRRAPATDRPSPGSARPPPPAGSWAAAVLHGVKRLPVANTLDHRPKKRSIAPNSAPIAPQPSDSSSKAATPQPGHRPAVSAPKANDKQPTANQSGSTGKARATVPAQSSAPARPGPHGLSNTALDQVNARLDGLEQLMSTLEGFAPTLTRVTQTMEAFASRLSEQQRSTAEQQRVTSDALTALAHQLGMLNHRLDAMQPHFLPAGQMLPPPFVPMGPLTYPNYMTSPMATMQQSAALLSAGASSSAAAYTPNYPTTSVTSQPYAAPHQASLSSPQQWASAQPLTQNAYYDLSLTSETSASAAPAQNGEVARHG
jgi:chemotaxis protein histidine kinase CheA